MARRPHKGGVSRAVFKKPREDAAALLQSATVVSGTHDPTSIHQGDAAGGEIGGTFAGSLTVTEPTLASLKALSAVADKLPYYTAAQTFGLTDLTAYIRTLLDDADATAARTTLDMPGPPRFYVERTVPTAVGDFVEIGNITPGVLFTHPAFDLGISCGHGNFVVSKRYLIPGFYGNSVGMVNNTWYKAVPISTTGPFNTNDFDLEVMTDTAKFYLRLRRTAGANAGIAKISGTLWGEDSDFFTSTNATGTGGAPVSGLPNTLIEQIGGQLRLWGPPAGGSLLTALLYVNAQDQLRSPGDAVFDGGFTTGTTTGVVQSYAGGASRGGLRFGPNVFSVTELLYSAALNQLRTNSKLIADLGLDAGSNKLTNLAAGVAASDGARMDQLPTAAQMAALAGSNGSPSISNRYVTESDPRLSLTAISITDAMKSLQPVHYLMHTSGLTDLGSSANNGTANGGLTQSGPSLTSDGMASWDFDGIDDYISSAFSGFPAGQEMTVVFFIQRDSAGDATSRWYFADTNNTWALGHLNGAGAHTFKLPPTGSATIGPQPPAAGAPYMLAMRVKGGSFVELLINGLRVARTVTTSNFAASGGGFQIGRSTTFFHDGKIAHFAIFNKQLSDASLGWLASIGLGFRRDYGMVTALPPLASWGDKCTYIADLTNGVYWDLVYDGQGSYPWKYMGGAPLQAYSNGSVTATSTTYVTPTGTAISLTLPLAGDYDICAECHLQNSGANTSRYSYAVGALAASDDWGAFDATGGATTKNSTKTGPEYRHVSRSASDVITEKANVTAGTGTFARRKLYARPVRVG